MPHGDHTGQRAVTIIVPAHDEVRSVGRLLDALAAEPSGGAFLRVVVVANGCTDTTADVARQHGAAEVLELAEGNKQGAMRAGAALARDFPIVFVDADVVISGPDLRRLVAALDEPDVLAVAPERRLDLTGAAPLVRSYYRVWSELPTVRAGLFGRGVIALSKAGHERVAGLPRFMSDDLALSESFAPTERRVVPDAFVTVRGPRRTADLVRRRLRIIAGNEEFDAAGESRAKTSLATLAELLRRRPRLLPDIVVFAGVTLVARIKSRGHDAEEATWWRDESSREA